MTISEENLRTEKAEEYLSLCKCDECPLDKRRVLGEGVVRNEDGTVNIIRYGEEFPFKLAFVGMAPAREELAEGRPFVGRSGQLLRLSVKRLGYRDYYITNVLLCELPDDISGAEEALAIRCCKDRLFAEIQDRNLDLVIALGNMPLEALTGVDYKIKSVEGRVLPGLICPVLPVTHPAAILRRTDEFFEFTDALEAGLSWVNGTYQQAVIPNMVVVDRDNIGEVLQVISNAPEVVVDIETTGRGFYPYGRDPDQIRCITISVDSKTAYIFPGKSSPHFEEHPDFSQDPRLIEVLNASKCIFHNGQFDCGFLWQAGYRTRIHYDTMLAHYMLDEREYSHSLKHLSHKYLGAPDWENDIKRFLPSKSSSYDLIPDKELYWYASHDTIYTHHLKSILEKKVNSKVYDTLMLPCANMFTDLRHRGLPIDVGVLMELDDVLDRELEKSEDELRELVGYYLNPFSAPECAELLYDQMKLPITPRFGRSTSKRALAQYAGMPVVDKILECRDLGKLRSTYVMGVANFVDMNFRIHPFTKLFGTVTGRISTEDPSVMNVAKHGGIMKLYVPDKGHLLLAADQKQMELRCYAIISGDEHLKSILLTVDPENKLNDPHYIVQMELLKRTGRLFKRGTVKSGVFGRLYGRGLESFIYGFGMTRDDATAVIAVIDSLFPTIRQYNQEVRNQIHKNGYLTSFFERHRRFGLITDENRHELYRQGSNFKVQSMASDVNLYCMLHLYEMSRELGIVPLFPVHDSIIFDIEAEEVVPRLVREIQDYSRELVNGEMEFRVDLKLGPNWGDAVDYKVGV